MYISHIKCMLQRTVALFFPLTWGLYSPIGTAERQQQKMSTGDVLQRPTSSVLWWLYAERLQALSTLSQTTAFGVHFVCLSLLDLLQGHFRNSDLVSIWIPFYSIPPGLLLPLGPLQNTLTDMRLSCMAHK